MSHPAVKAARLRSATLPERAFIEMSSLINRPWNPINPRITCRTIVTEVVAGATGSMALKTTCAVIPIGKSASGRNAAKSTASRGARGGGEGGQFGGVSEGGPAVPRKVLYPGETPAGQQAVRNSFRDSCNFLRLTAVSAVTYNWIATYQRHIGQRQAVSVYAERPK